MGKLLKGHFLVKDNADAKSIIIEGFANKAVKDRVGDLIPKEAWELDNFAKNPIIFFNHDSNQPIGKAIGFEPAQDGLKIKIRLSRTKEGNVPMIRDLISEGILKSFSVGFDDHGSSEKDGDGNNVIKRAELIETSVVSVPMNQDSLFTVVGGEKSGKLFYTKAAYNCKSQNLEDFSSYDELKEKVLIDKGALVAVALHNAIKMNQEINQEDFIKHMLLDSADSTEKNVAEILAGNILPVPEEFLKTAAEVMGLDVESLKNLNKGMDKPHEEEEEEEEGHEKSINKDFQECVASKIPKLIEEGLDRDKAIAQAISMCETEGKCVASPDDLKEAVVTANAAVNPPEEKQADTQPPVPMGEPSKEAAEFQTGQPSIELMKGQLSLLGMMAQLQKETLEELRRLSNIMEGKGPEVVIEEEEEDKADPVVIVEEEEEEEEEEDEEEAEKMLKIQKDMAEIAKAQKKLTKLLAS